VLESDELDAAVHRVLHEDFQPVQVDQRVLHSLPQVDLFLLACFVC